MGAQITALGLVFNVVSAGEISKLAGMWIGSGSILIYTLFGGMWAVAITDLLQMVIICVGMVYIGGEVSGMVGGVASVVQHASAAGKFTFWPTPDLKEILAFTAAWITMMFGSIPQQDVFQRVQSSKTIKIAVLASITGGCLYFIFAFVPIFLAYSATLIDPEMVNRLINTDPQMILPTLVLEHAPLIAQVVFFGALLSAIKSCASATLLAPSVTFTENILKPMLGDINDRELLRWMRIITLSFTLLVTLYAINSKMSIFKMVESAYQITLVVAFIPLACGVYWRKATNQGALISILMGLLTWVGMLIFTNDPLIPAQFAGVLASAAGMLLGSLLPQKISGPLPEHLSFLQSHASSQHQY